MRYQLVVLVMLSALSQLGLAQDGALQAGAAKVDITPPESALPNSTDILRDHIYVRAIAITNGQQCAVLVTGCAPENYIYSDAASHQLTFQIIASHLKPSCAEEKIASTAMDLIHQAQ